jgi:hypothetical protein
MVGAREIMNYKFYENLLKLAHPSFHGATTIIQFPEHSFPQILFSSSQIALQYHFSQFFSSICHSM